MSVYLRMSVSIKLGLILNTFHLPRPRGKPISMVNVNSLTLHPPPATFHSTPSCHSPFSWLTSPAEKVNMMRVSALTDSCQFRSQFPIARYIHQVFLYSTLCGILLVIDMSMRVSHCDCVCACVCVCAI